MSIADEIESYLREAREDWVGLWQLVGAMEEKTQDRQEFVAGVYAIARGLLVGGLMAGNLTKDGGFKAWPEQDCEQVIARVRKEWDALGHDPNIDDICWFGLPGRPGFVR
jgi:hypothetical protein